MKQVLKTISNGLAMAIVAPCALLCAIDRFRPTPAERMFAFWAQCFSLVPGLPGAYLRRAFYRWTLDHCSADCHIGFGAFFSHPQATVESGVYIGAYAILGAVRLGRGSLIGSRASIPSGGRQHELGADGRWTATDWSHLVPVEVGADCWIGEGAIVLANVGPRCAVAAGAVVSSPVPAGVMVAGNPARFVKKLQAPEHEAPLNARPAPILPQSEPIAS